MHIWDNINRDSNISNHGYLQKLTQYHETLNRFCFPPKNAAKELESISYFSLSLMQCEPGVMWRVKSTEIASSHNVPFLKMEFKVVHCHCQWKGTYSRVSVCGPAMCHHLLKVTIILSASWANKGCGHVDTRLVSLCWKNGFGTLLELANKLLTSSCFSSTLPAI